MAAALAEFVQQDLEAEPVHVASVKKALQIIPEKIAPEEIAIAIFDIEVLDGQSFPVGR